MNDYELMPRGDEGGMSAVREHLQPAQQGPSAIVEVSAVQALTAHEIRGQVDAAHAHPRSTALFKRELAEMLSEDVEMAESCIYSLPRRERRPNGDYVTKAITGPSARFAELVQYAWGNNRGGGRVVGEEHGFIIAQGVFHDLQKNSLVTMEVRRRITDKYGRRFTEDMVGVTGNAAASIAHRNSVLKGVPKIFWKPLYDHAKKVALGTIQTLPAKREKVITFFAHYGITEAMVLAKLDVKGRDDIGLDELEILAGLRTAIREDGADPRAIFAPDIENGRPVSRSSDSLAERYAAKPGADPAPAAATSEASPAPGGGVTYDGVMQAIEAATDLEALEEAADLIDAIADDGESDRLRVRVEERLLELDPSLSP